MDHAPTVLLIVSDASVCSYLVLSRMTVHVAYGTLYGGLLLLLMGQFWLAMRNQTYI